MIQYIYMFKHPCKHRHTPTLIYALMPPLIVNAVNPPVTSECSSEQRRTHAVCSQFTVHSNTEHKGTHMNTWGHTLPHLMAVFPWWICWCDIFSPLCGEGCHGDALLWQCVFACMCVCVSMHLSVFVCIGAHHFRICCVSDTFICEGVYMCDQAFLLM